MVFKICTFSVSLYYIVFANILMKLIRKIGKVCSLLLIFANILQCLMTKPSYYFYLTELWSETLPMCPYGLKH